MTPTPATDRPHVQVPPVQVPQVQLPAGPGDRAGLIPLVAAVRGSLIRSHHWEETAAEAAGDPVTYTSHTLHADPDGSFSIVALVWLPGQTTTIHDHITWCAFGVIQGVEHEDLFDNDLNPIRRGNNHAGTVRGFAPPGDIHRVHNIGTRTAISIQIYGTDVTRVGSSVRRIYTPKEQS